MVKGENQPMRPLSKSQFTRGMKCDKSLWLYRMKPELRDTTSPDQQFIFDQGTEVGILAQQWIGGGVLIKADHKHQEEALAETKAAIAAGAKVLYEAAFMHDDVLVRVDIMAQGPGGVWDLYEVKSSTDVEDVYMTDAAIQRYVLAGAGVNLGVVHVVHIDSTYVRQGALDLQKLFKPVDVTAETDLILPNIPKQLERMKADCAMQEAPKVGIGPHCSKPQDCDFMGHCWAHVPDYSVFNLAGARKDKTTELWNRGIKTVADIPDWDGNKKDQTYKLTDYQNVQREAARSKQLRISMKPIAEMLRELGWPRYFLDFEAVNRAIPAFDGLRPYQQMPFEASVHVRRKPGASLEHAIFMADGTKDPRVDLAEFLRATLGDRGPVIAYHKSYEGGILKSLENCLTHGNTATAMLQAESRLWDLADPFKKAYYHHPDFLGRWSIKAVLPVLVPDMTYAGLAIRDGAAAMQAYTRLMTDKLTPAERAKIIEDLKAYCGQDTLAMVRILDHLELMVGQGAAA